MSTNRVRRRVVACARCRLRKIVCDAASPSCSKCSQAGVACVAVSASNQASAPRSIVQFLEKELANREESENKLDQLESANHILVDQVMKDCTPLFLGLTSSIPLLRCAVAGTRLPSASLPGAVELTEQHQTSLLDSEAGSTRLADIPVSVADFLFENYVKRVVIQNPIFYLPDIVQYFDSVYHNPIHSLEPGSLSTPYETYIVSLIMAISLTTSARTQQFHANSIAMGLLKTAMQHTQAVYTNDLKGLQAILLLCEYAFLNPSVADVWLLSGFSTQICIDLGLHQETSGDLKQDPLTIDMRRRVFWCAYEMEIATSAALLRPTCFLTKHINTPFPSEVEDGAISATGIDASAPATKAFALWIWKYRRIEAEVISVLFHNGEISLPETLDLWTQRMENAIDTWRTEFLGFVDLNNGDATSEEMKLYATIAHAYVIVSLFRPSPRVKERSSESLIKAFVACVDVAKGYHAQSNLGFGNSKYVFHPCYHTFSAAIVFLQSLERCKASICLRYTVDEIEDFISSFSKSFTAIAERWPAASRCLEEFERLMVPVKCKYIDFTLNEARAASNRFGSTASLIDRGDGNTAQPLLYSDELMDFQSLFPHDVFNTQDIGGLPFTIPSDWEFEFDFGIT